MYRQALILVPLFLAGCAGHQLDEEKKQDKAAAAEAAAAVASIDDAKCQSFGFKPSSPAYIQCRKDFDDQHKQLSGTNNRNSP